MTIQEHLLVLGLGENVSWEEVIEQRAFLIQLYHPDRLESLSHLQQKAEQKLKQINASFSELKKYKSIWNSIWKTSSTTSSNNSSVKKEHYNTTAPEKQQENSRAEPAQRHTNSWDSSILAALFWFNVIFVCLLFR